MTATFFHGSSVRVDVSHWRIGRRKLGFLGAFLEEENAHQVARGVGLGERDERIAFQAQAGRFGDAKRRRGHLDGTRRGGIVAARFGERVLARDGRDDRARRGAVGERRFQRAGRLPRASIFRRWRASLRDRRCRPRDPAFFAGTPASCLPVRIISSAFGKPTRRGRRTEPPHAGRMPICTSGRPSLVAESLHATRQSQARVSSNPPPTQTPWIAATVGTRRRRCG